MNGMVESDDKIGSVTAEPTIVLIRRVQAGDAGARERLLRRFLPLLQRWAHGRLPRQMRDLNETDDLVQVTLVKALARLDQFESAGPGAFLAYLRQALLNQVRDEIRRHQRRPEHAQIDVELSDPEAPALIERIVGSERVRAYEQALAALPKRQQGLIVMRVEFGMSYPEIAAEVGSTPDAVRVMVARAIVQLSSELGTEQS
ncbi:MAG: sigma-70 family RNA polymerase sigma factor [Rudaea sp.]|nr:sigma-70 family RNA polymerase sigma factor [Rudaea sp.]